MIHDPRSWLAVDTAPARRATTHDSRPATMVWVCGDVDMATHSILATALHQAVLSADHAILLDVSAMVFCDATGLGILMRETARAVDRGVEVTMIGLSPRLVALCTTLWPGPHPTHYRNVAAAVAAGALAADRHLEVSA